MLSHPRLACSRSSAATHARSVPQDPDAAAAVALRSQLQAAQKDLSSITAQKAKVCCRGKIEREREREGGSITPQNDKKKCAAAAAVAPRARGLKRLRLRICRWAA
jgi:hypothetical protein